MKKIKTIIILTVFAIMLASCGKTEIPEINKARDSAVNIAERFMSNDITASEAKERLDNMYIPSTEGNGSLFLQVDVDYLSYLLTKKDFDTFADKVESVKGRNYDL